MRVLTTKSAKNTSTLNAKNSRYAGAALAASKSNQGSSQGATASRSRSAIPRDKDSKKTTGKERNVLPVAQLAPVESRKDFPRVSGT